MYVCMYMYIYIYICNVMWFADAVEPMVKMDGLDS